MGKLRLMLLALCVVLLRSVTATNAQMDAGAPPGAGGLAPTPSAHAPEVPGSPTVEQAAKQFGVTPGQMAALQEKMAQGGVSENDIQELCARVAAKHLKPTDIDAMAGSFVLSIDQIAELKRCSAEGDAAGLRSANASDKSLRAEQTATPTPGAERPNESSIEKGFRDLANPYRNLPSPNPAALSQFGYSLFSSKVSTFAPVSDVPVGSDYILGPGDELSALLWGRVNQTLHLQVERDGTVLVPELGPLQVAGLSFAQAKKLIEGRAGDMTGVQVDVTMGQLRTIQVFIIGNVDHPGLYTISALSHISNALVATGGISKVGSLRRIELRRGNQVTRVIDLYRVLLHGDTSDDVRLEPRDVIFVPVIGPVVAIAGDVKNPGIYELKGSEDLAAVLKMAGGVAAFGYSPRLQVDRIDNHERRIALDINLQAAASSLFQVRDGDLIKVFTVLPEHGNVVTLEGNARRPGVYEWYSGMRVADLVREGEGVADRTFFGYALVRRLIGPSRNTHYLPVNLGEALSDRAPGTENIALEPRDELVVYSQNDLQDIPAVTIRGAIRKPGTYPLSGGMKVSDLVFQAGGLRADAYKAGAQLSRSEVIDGAKSRHTQMDIDLRAALSGGSDDIQLQRGDEVFIQQASNWHAPWEITVEGEVMRPGPYPISEQERLTTVLLQCGGLRPDAYLPAVVFVRTSVKKLEQKRLDESRARLQQEIARLTLMPRQAGEAEGDRTQGLAMMEQVVADAEGQQAVGRIVLHLAALNELEESSDNLILEDGDKIAIPKRPVSVNVLGQVYNPTAIVYRPGSTVRDYLARAGGPTEDADSEHVFVIKADGSVLTDDGIRNSRKASLFPLLPVTSGGLMGARLEPGDTVFVPERLIYVNGLQYAKDVTQIIANTAMSLAVLGVLASNL